MAAREEDKAMAGLLRRSLAQDAGSRSGEDCPEPEILAAYFDHALDAQETAHYDLHFSRCSHCREQLAAMARVGSALTARDAEKKTASGWDWLARSRWLMPAAAALVALLVISGIALRMKKAVVPTSEIAMARPDAVPQANSVPPMNSAPSPEVAPAGGAASIAPTDQFAVRPSAPIPHRAGKVPVAPGEFSVPSSSGARETSRRQPRADMAARLNVLPQRSPGMAREGMRAGDASAAAGAPVISANEAVTVTEAAPALDSAAPPAVAPAKKAEADSNSNDSDVSVSAQSDEAKQLNAPKAKSAATESAAVAAQSPKAMNLAADKAAGSAAFARLQQAQISPNLMNLQIQTPDPKILWMVASAGAIEKSEDGGTTWKPKYLETRAPIVAGSAPTVKICWLVGGNGTILRTTNGTHWKTISAPAETDFVRVEATDALNATVTAMDGRKFSTSDGGKSWSSAE